AEILPAWEHVDAALEAVVSQARDRGELRQDRSPSELTRVFLTLVNGLVMEHWFQGSSIKLADIPGLAVDYFLDGAAPR
ncbi:MAG: hypothetical protein P8N50_04615, partial [Actinomycetota bacterium]|nr:hypothetical protein [Actinomycetota bacterium]